MAKRIPGIWGGGPGLLEQHHQLFAEFAVYAAEEARVEAEAAERERVRQRRSARR